MSQPEARPRRAPWPRRRAIVRAAVGLALLCAPAAHAHQRLLRLYDERDGLAVAEIFELAQDARGFLWIGASSGLVRFDGREFRRWAPDRIRHVVRALACDERGDALVAASDEPLWRVHDGTVEPERGPDGRPIRDWTHATLTPDGTLGVLQTDSARVRDARGAWRTWARAAFDTSAFVRAIPWAGETLLVSTERGLYAVAPPGPPRRLQDVGRVVAARPWPDGGMIALTDDGRLWRFAGRTRELLLAARSGAGMVVRGRAVWATLEQYVIALVPGSPPDTIAPSPWCPTGRAYLVDREGSLWIGGYGGLLQMPEPGTRIWGPAEGLPSPAHAFGVAPLPGGVRVLTWYGACDVHPDAATRRTESLGRISGGCFEDAHGRLWWAERERGFRVLERGASRFFARPGLHRISAAAPRRDGRTWFATDDGLFLAPARDGAPVFVGPPPPAGWGGGWTDIWLTGVAEDPRGRLWVARGEEIAWTDADSLALGRPVAWRVSRLPGCELVTALRLLPDGTPWAATSIAGMWRWQGETWREDPGNASLPSLRVYDVVPARPGGWWLLDDGWIGRVTPLAGGGWRVDETLSAWQGLPSLQAGGLLEEPGGRLWIASLAGLVEVPPDARRAPRAPPRVELVEVRVNGRTMPLGRPLVLPDRRRNNLDVRFTALTFRDPSHLRYQARLLPGGAWAETRDPEFHAVGLAAGRHALEVRASLDGERWSAAPASLAFRVRPPWYLEPWALAAFALGIVAATLAAHRMRVGVLLRLERQRMRIAMDLHDEMGSGLGSIGILAGLAADDVLGEDARRRLAGEIAGLSSDLGATLSEIVRSLHAGADTLDRWAARLAERAQRLVPGPSPALRVVYPATLPALELGPDVRREVQLAAVEALHNAARHAQARHVTLGLAPDGTRWRLWIEDDGLGLAPDAFERPGSFGLANMRRRLESVRGSVSWQARLGGGTRVEMRFAAVAQRRGGRGLHRMFMRNARPPGDGSLVP